MVQEHHEEYVSRAPSSPHIHAYTDRPRSLVPIILKGIGSAEDAILAYEAGVQGIVLSNHGGRQLDTARSGIEVLVEVVSALRLRGYFPDPRFEIYVDGGVRRASDVLKAIALGATAVGVGRPFLYAFCAYGQEGVEKAIQIFRVSVSWKKQRWPVWLNKVDRMSSR